MNKTMWNDVAREINNHNRFLLTTHVNPDGDAIGSELALAFFLESYGKEVVIVNSSQTPQSMTFLDPSSRIRVYPDDYDDALLDKADVVFIVDVNNWSHVGGFGDVLRQSPVKRICIDHHQGIDEGFANIHVADTSASATGILIYELIQAMGGDITREIADAIYTTVVTDTGNYRFSNTDVRTFTIAAELLGHGVKPFAIQRNAFSKTHAAVKLLGVTLSTLDHTPDGKIAWIHVTNEMLKKAGANYEDSDGILDVVRAIHDVEYCLFFKEMIDGRVKISLRSNGNVDVYEIARHFGGGGHRMASGMSVDGPINSAIKNVINTCKKL